VGGFRLRWVSLTLEGPLEVPQPPSLSTIPKTPDGSTWGSPLRRTLTLTDGSQGATMNWLMHKPVQAISARCCLKNTQPLTPCGAAEAAGEDRAKHYFSVKSKSSLLPMGSGAANNGSIRSVTPAPRRNHRGIASAASQSVFRFDVPLTSLILRPGGASSATPCQRPLANSARDWIAISDWPADREQKCTPDAKHLVRRSGCWRHSPESAGFPCGLRQN
jgi:hypothetical protein